MTMPSGRLLCWWSLEDQQKTSRSLCLIWKEPKGWHTTYKLKFTSVMFLVCWLWSADLFFLVPIIQSKSKCIFVVFSRKYTVFERQTFSWCLHPQARDEHQCIPNYKAVWADLGAGLDLFQMINSSELLPPEKSPKILRFESSYSTWKCLPSSKWFLSITMMF